MSAGLAPEVVVALERSGLRPRRTWRMSTLTIPPTFRTVDRIELDSGVTIKARRLESEEAVRRQCDLRASLPETFAPVIGCHGSVLLEAWVEGQELADVPPEPGLVAEAGGLLARLHGTSPAAGRVLPFQGTTAEWRESTRVRLEGLEAAGALTAGESAAVGRTLDVTDPGIALRGLVHTDFCGENFVIDGSGRLHVVDNERIGIDALGYDVGRTWYRWALPDGAWETFRTAYLSGNGPAEAFEHVVFWGIVATVQSAELRLRASSARAEEPISRLRSLRAIGVGIGE